jgi:hypothetical protein
MQADLILHEDGEGNEGEEEEVQPHEYEEIAGVCPNDFDDGCPEHCNDCKEDAVMDIPGHVV